MKIHADTSEKGEELFYFHSIITEMRRVWNSTDEFQKIEGSWFSSPIALQGKWQHKCPYIKAVKTMNIFDFMERGTSEKSIRPNIREQICIIIWNVFTRKVFQSKLQILS